MQLSIRPGDAVQRCCDGHRFVSAPFSSVLAVRQSALTAAPQLLHDYREHMPDLILNTKSAAFNWNFVHEKFINLDSDAAEKQW